MSAVLEPVCTCGHDAEEHNYDPSGCDGTECLVPDGGYDEDGWPVGQVCSCTDYEPIGEEE